MAISNPLPNFSDRRIIVTSDGSHSLQLNGMDEHYHSTHGALQESMHVFIQNGLLSLENTHGPINILEVGFGTGLNALLSLQHAGRLNYSVNYLALEPYPLEPFEYSQLNFAAAMDDPQLKDLFQGMHQAAWETPVAVVPYFSIQKIKKTLEEAVLPEDTFHLVYFDAFAPDIQPEMWTPELFAKIVAAMKHGAILVTYCAKGSVRRAMKGAGLQIEKLPGPPGKREMTRGRFLLR